MIEPVGMGNNETDDYDELVAEIQNLTEAIEELRLEIEELQASRYDAPDYSVITIGSYESHQEWSEDGNSTVIYFDFIPEYNITKDGNSITIDYIGMGVGGNIGSKIESGACINHSPQLKFVNSEGIPFSAYGGGNAMHWMAYDNVEVSKSFSSE